MSQTSFWQVKPFLQVVFSSIITSFTVQIDREYFVQMSEQAIRVSADAQYHCINIKSLELQYCLPGYDYLKIKVIMLRYIIDYPKKVKSKEYMLRVSGQNSFTLTNLNFKY